VNLIPALLYWYQSCFQTDVLTINIATGLGACASWPPAGKGQMGAKAGVRTSS